MRSKQSTAACEITSVSAGRSRAVLDRRLSMHAAGARDQLLILSASLS